jgi:hypothetical protein
MRLDLLAALNEERWARRAAVLVTDLGDGTQRLVRADEIRSPMRSTSGCSWARAARSNPAASAISSQCRFRRRG